MKCLLSLFFSAGLVINLTACVDTGTTEISFPLFVAGQTPPPNIMAAGGTLITPTEAQMVFGPLYLCAGANAGELCESARAEILDAVVVDLLQPIAKIAGPVNGTTGAVNSFMYDMGFVSLLSAQEPLALPATNQLGGHSLQVRGVATVAGFNLPFVTSLKVFQDQDTEKGIPVIRSNAQSRPRHHLSERQGPLLLRFDPTTLFAAMDFSDFVRQDSCAPGGPATVCAAMVESRCAANGAAVDTRDCAAVGQICVPKHGCVDHILLNADDQPTRALRVAVTTQTRPIFDWNFVP